MTKYFRDVAIGAEFWFDGKFWIKTSKHGAVSQTTIRSFETDEVVL